jgi:hypothetical protein
LDLSNENVIHIKKDGVEYLQFRRLLEYNDIINHAYSLGIDKDYRTAKANKQKLDSIAYQKAIEDYTNLCKAIDSKPEHLIKTNQDHTDKVKVVKEKINLTKPDFNLAQYDKTDGLITNQKNMLLATTNADCILLLFFDPVKKVISNSHSGWRGTLQRISVKTVEKMKEEFNCNPQDIICCICPSIRKCHFEVDREVKDEFEKEFKDIEKMNEIIVETIPNQKWNIDTVKINQIILQTKGLKPENIIDSKICSVCHSDLVHSYRVEKQGYGLSTALIELK